MSKSYIVNGSEDGIIAVFTNQNKAIDCAKTYVTKYSENDEPKCTIEKNKYVIFVAGDHSTANIEIFYTNSNPF